MTPPTSWMELLYRWNWKTRAFSKSLISINDVLFHALDRGSQGRHGLVHWAWYTVNPPILKLKETSLRDLSHFSLAIPHHIRGFLWKGKWNTGQGGWRSAQVRVRRCPPEQPKVASPWRAKMTIKEKPKPQSCKGPASDPKEKMSVEMGITRLVTGKAKQD